MKKGMTGLYWIALIALVSLVAFYVVKRDFNGVYLDYRRSAENLSAKIEERERLVDVARELTANIAGLSKKDPLTREKAFREAGFVKPGDTIYEIGPTTATQ